MNTRRTFLRLIAAVAIAPEIAFRTKLPLPAPELPVPLIYRSNAPGIHAQLEACGVAVTIDSFTDEQSKLNIQKLMEDVYRVRKERGDRDIWLRNDKP